MLFSPKTIRAGFVTLGVAGVIGLVAGCDPQPGEPDPAFEEQGETEEQQQPQPQPLTPTE